MRIECDVKYTEDPEKLLKMLQDFFPGARLEVRDGRIVGEADEKAFWEKIREQQVLPALKKELEEKGVLELSKLAMLAGKASVDAGFPLGSVRVYPSS